MTTKRASFSVLAAVCLVALLPLACRTAASWPFLEDGVLPVLLRPDVEHRVWHAPLRVAATPAGRLEVHSRFCPEYSGVSELAVVSADNEPLVVELQSAQPSAAAQCAPDTMVLRVLQFDILELLGSHPGQEMQFSAPEITSIPVLLPALPATGDFVATHSWQRVAPGQAVPRGLHVRMDFRTGVKQARLLVEAQAAQPLRRRSDLPPDPQLRILGGRIEDSVLALNVNHGGGCGEHEYELVLADLSDPNNAVLELRHGRNGDNCKAIVEAALRFDLAPLQHATRPRTISLQGTSFSASLAPLADHRSAAIAVVPDVDEEQINKLAKSEQQESDAKAAQAERDQELYLRWVTEHLEAANLAAFVEVIGDPTSTREARIEALLSLEDLVHDADRARELLHTGDGDVADTGLRALLELWNNSKSDIEIHQLVTRVLGSAMQTNPPVQSAAVKQGLLAALLQAATEDSNFARASLPSTIFALSALLRGEASAQEQLVLHSGWDLLATSYSLCLRASDSCRSDVIARRLTALADDMVAEEAERFPERSVLEQPLRRTLQRSRLCELLLSRPGACSE